MKMSRMNEFRCEELGRYPGIYQAAEWCEWASDLGMVLLEMVSCQFGDHLQVSAPRGVHYNSVQTPYNRVLLELKRILGRWTQRALI